MTEMPRLLYTDVETDLRATVRKLLAEHCSWTDVLRRCEGDSAYDAALWRRLAADLGCAALLIPEEHGGAGASARETAVVLEELGRAVAPVPYLGSAVLATSALLASDPVPRALLASLAAGERTAALTVPYSTAPGRPFPATVTASPGQEPSLSGTVLSGTVTFVVDAAVADVLVVPAATADGPALYIVDTDAVGVRVRPRTSLDLTRPVADVILEGASGRLVALGQQATTAVEAAIVAGAALLASEQLGIAEWCLATTVEYGLNRHQFGRPIGSFQAVKHRLADLWSAVTSARAVARYAAACLAEGDDDLPVAAALAQAFCSDVAVTAAEECLQLHGGIGFTWEHPMHLYLKRAKASEIAFGSPDRHRALLAKLVDIPAPLC